VLSLCCNQTVSLAERERVLRVECVGNSLEVAHELLILVRSPFYNKKS
jgi:hypothetical protein